MELGNEIEVLRLQRRSQPLVSVQPDKGLKCRQYPVIGHFHKRSDYMRPRKTHNCVSTFFRIPKTIVRVIVLLARPLLEPTLRM